MSAQDKVTRIAAVKMFFEREPNGFKVGMNEFQAFWGSLSAGEKLEFSEAAAKAMGVEIAEKVDVPVLV